MTYTNLGFGASSRFRCFFTFSAAKLTMGLNLNGTFIGPYNIFKPIYCLAQILLCPLESFHLHYQYAELIALQDPSNSAITFQLTVGAMYHEMSNPGFVCSAALFHGHSDSPVLAMHGVGMQLSHCLSSSGPQQYCAPQMSQ